MTILQRATGFFLSRGYSQKWADLLAYYVDLLMQQVTAIVPITVMLVVTMGIYFRRTVQEPGVLAGGTVAAIVGLTLFIDALRVCVMPLGERLGRDLPRTVSLPWALATTGFLGALVTYAEPAISSLRPLAALVDPEVAPYLHLALNAQQEVLVLSIALGVASAAMIGTLRFVRGWNLRPLIFGGMVPTLGLACYMWWGNPELRPLLGLAWDSGAVTTGPVTVPILVSLGIGVMRTKKEQNQEAKDKEEASHAQETTTKDIEASVPPKAMPLPTVVEPTTRTSSAISNSSGIMAEGPAHNRPRIASTASDCGARARFGSLYSIADDEAMQNVGQVPVTDTLNEILLVSATEDIEGFGIVTLASIFPVLAVEIFSIALSLRYSHDEVLAIALESAQKQTTQEIPLSEQSPIREIIFAIRSILPLNVGLILLCLFVLKKAPPRLSFFLTTEEDNNESDQQQNQGTALPNQATQVQGPSGQEMANGSASAPKESFFVRHGALMAGIVEAQAGMMLFNLGLTYGFTSIGDQVGNLLPAAFMRTEMEGDASPYYSNTGGGIVLVLWTMFFLGILATRAEPALFVVGSTVERLSKGSFKASHLVNAVCIGVGLGMAVGSTKILFSVGLIWFILAKYTIAVSLTIFAKEDFVNIAWDCAGVTTGPVTVPFVLSTGIGFSKAVQAAEGFGILASASVWPIITVLLTDAARRAYRSLTDKGDTEAKPSSPSHKNGQSGQSAGGQQDIAIHAHNIV